MIFSSGACPPDPELPAQWAAVNLAVLIAGIVLLAGGALAWYVLRHEGRMRVRSTRVQILLWAAILCGLLAVTLRRAFPNTVPCILWVLLYFHLAALLTTAGAARVLVAVYQDLRTQNALKFAREYNDNGTTASTKEDDTESENTSSFPAKRRYMMQQFLADLLLVLRGRTMTDDGHSLNMSTVTFLRNATGKNFWQLFVIYYAPIIVYVGVLIAVVAPYREACMTCPFYWELYIAFIAYSIMAGIPLSLVSMRLPLARDQTGLVFEIKLTQVGTVAICLAWILLPIDINGIEEGSTWTQELLALIGLYQIWFVWTALQLIIALKERYERAHAVRHLDRVPLEQALISDETFQAFLEFSERFFVVESVRFIRSVTMWKQGFSDARKSSAFRRARAKAIARAHVYHNAALEINISDAVREAIIAELSVGDSVPPDLFDAAMREVVSMLRFTIWLDFLRYRALNRRTNVVVAEGGV